MRGLKTFEFLSNEFDLKPERFWRKKAFRNLFKIFFGGGTRGKRFLKYFRRERFRKYFIMFRGLNEESKSISLYVNCVTYPYDNTQLQAIRNHKRLRNTALQNKSVTAVFQEITFTCHSSFSCILISNLSNNIEK